MTTLERALERVQYCIFDRHSYGLAIHKASQETGVSVADISAEMSRRKAAKKARASYRAAVPNWAKDY